MKTIVLLPILMILIGIGVNVYGVFVILRKTQSSGWPGTQGKITRSEVERSQPDRYKPTRAFYKANIEYEYVVDRQVYRGHLISMDRAANYGYAESRKLHQRYPVGKDVTVHYNPEDVTLAVLETHIRFADVWNSFMPGFILLLIGGPLLLAILFDLK